MAISGEPVDALFGENPETVGTGLRMFTTKLEVPPPGEGFEIKPGSWPTLKFAGKANVMPLPFSVPAAPPSVAVVVAPEVLMKPLPVTVTVVAGEPALIEEGETELTTGAGFAGGVTVNVNAPLLPPPGLGFDTDTGSDPGLNSLTGTKIVMEVDEELDGDEE
jgi:hypothetical protein